MIDTAQVDPIIRIRNNRAGLIAEQSGCGKILGNSDIRLIWNDFPTESKVFRHLMNDALSIRPCPQASYGMSPRNQTFPAEVVRSERSLIRLLHSFSDLRRKLRDNNRMYCAHCN